MTPRRIATYLLAAVVGCAPPNPSMPSPPSAPAGSGEALRLERSGTLRQDEISVRLRAGPLRIEVTPLVPWVLEAAAPDTQTRLHRIAEAHGAQLATSTGRTGLTLVLVTLSASEPDAVFEPTDLHLVARGLRERPVAIRGISLSWGTGRIGQQSTSVAVYAFPAAMDLTRDMRVEYGEYSDDSWASVVPRIEAERGRTGA